ncbi:MAG: DUF4190 domain-containing protein [Pyrinomonadaceae bacterium]|jgi:hypothetical protein|nr:DUF4190 domain-containing protein [Pyrinomonadaceae bacterium]
MKTNPSCSRLECPKEFADSQNFCNICGDKLVEKAEVVQNEDSYNTVLGNQPDISNDPYKTIVAGSSSFMDDDILQIPDSSDPMKTVVVSDIGNQIPPPISQPNELPIPEPPSVPSFNEPSLAPPSFGEISSVPPPKFEEPVLPKPEIQEAPTMIVPPMEELPDFNSAPLPSESPFGKSDALPPIPSPFEQTMPKFEPPPYKEPEPYIPAASPFEPAMGNQQMDQQTAWTPPPAPVSSWQNQEIGQNTPFQPPAVVSQGQNQTLAIVSLVLGILSIVCCQLTGPVAIVTGWMAKNKADENPGEFGGRGLALAGFITGIIGSILLVLVIIYYIFVIGLVASGSI